MTLAFLGIAWLAFLVLTIWLSWARLRGERVGGWLIALTLIVVGRLLLFAKAPFFGLEYEDAYEYLYAALVYGANPGAASLGLTPLCVLGTPGACSSFATLSHPVGAGVFSWLLLAATGSLAGARVLGVAVTSAVSLIAVFAATWTRGRGAAGLSLLIVGTTPLVGLYALTGFAEVAGVLVLAGLLLSLEVLDDEASTSRWPVLALIGVAALLLPLVKRELLIVPLVAAIIVAVRSFRHPRAGDARRLAALAIGVSGALFASHGAVVSLAAARSSGLALFSVGTFARLLPAFLGYLLSRPALATYGVLLLGAAALGWRWRSTRFAAAVVAILLGLALSFSQSYWYAVHGELPIIHFERYAFLMWPLVAVIFARVLASARSSWSRIARASKLAGGSVLLLGIAFQVVATTRLEVNRYQEERAVRFAPVEKALAALPHEAWLITLDPILVALTRPEVQLVDLPSLDTLFSPGSFATFLRSEDIYLLLPEADLASERSRYPGAFNLLNSGGVRWIATGASIEGHKLLRGLPPSGAERPAQS